MKQSHKQWTQEEIDILYKCVENNEKTLEIDKKLPNRQRNGIEAKAKQLGIKILKSYPNWTEENKQKLIQLTKDGVSIKNIAQILDRTVDSINVQRSKLGLSRKTPKRIIWTEDNINKLKELINNNTPIKEISKYFDVTVSSIRTQCFKNNIPIPSKHKPFNQEELNFLLQNYLENGADFCSKCLSRPSWLIVQYANTMGLFYKITKQSEQYKYLKLINAAFFNRIRKGAKKRDVEFNITPKDIWELFIKQNKKCAYTGMELYLPIDDTESKNRTASLDRIDSDKDYERGELQWIHKRINWLKSAFSEEEFFYWIEKIYNYRIKPLKEQEMTDYCI